MNEKSQQKLNADYKDLSYPGAVAEFSWLPGFLIKLGPERVKGGELLKKCVMEKNLDLILIPEQTLYNIPETYHHCTKLRTLCIARKIEGVQDKTINTKQAKQIIDLVKGTDVGDLKWRNLVHCNNGQIAVIDTESFWGLKLGLHSLLENNTFDDEARKLVKQEIEEINNFNNKTLRF